MKLKYIISTLVVVGTFVILFCAEQFYNNCILTQKSPTQVTSTQTNGNYTFTYFQNHSDDWLGAGQFSKCFEVWIIEYWFSNQTKTITAVTCWGQGSKNSPTVTVPPFTYSYDSRENLTGIFIKGSEGDYRRFHQVSIVIFGDSISSDYGYGSYPSFIRSMRTNWKVDVFAYSGSNRSSSEKEVGPEDTCRYWKDRNIK